MIELILAIIWLSFFLLWFLPKYGFHSTRLWDTVNYVSLEEFDAINKERKTYSEWKREREGE